jgi:hypothetical protein
MSDERFSPEDRAHTPHQHHAGCKIPYDRRAMREVGRKTREDVGLQRDYEPVIRAACGMKYLRCWHETHLAICFEQKGLCFVAPMQTSKGLVRIEGRPISDRLAGDPNAV